MNIQKMHIAVQQGVDKINSLQADSLLSQEIDLELNKAIIRFVNLKYGKNNMYRTGFEQSQKRIDDLRSLVSTSEVFVYFKERRILSNVVNNSADFLFIDKYTIPDDYLHHVNSYCNVIQNPSCGNDVRFTLETRRNFKKVFKFTLNDLRVVIASPDAMTPNISSLFSNASNAVSGWSSSIDITGGATASGDGIDFANASSISEIGGATTFSGNVWDASDDGFLSGFIEDTSFLQFNTDNPALVGLDCNTNYFDLGTSTSVIQEAPSYITNNVSYHVTVDRSFKKVIVDNSFSMEEQVIASVLNTDAPGVEVFYENYAGNYELETFVVEIDTAVWGSVIDLEQAGLIADTLATAGSSVDLSTGTIVSDTTGTQLPNDFVSKLDIAWDVLYRFKKTKLAWRITDGVEGVITQTVTPTYETDFTGPVVSVIQTNVNEPSETYVMEFASVYADGCYSDFMFDRQLITIFEDGLQYRVRALVQTVDTGNVTALKRWLSNENWAMNENLYVTVAGIGAEFPGISKPIKYVQHDDVLGLLYDPFNKPTDDKILGVFDNDNIFVYTLIPNMETTAADLVSVLPYSVKLKYLRNPVAVSLSLSTSCDLPQHTHEEIVAMTVSGILEGISDPRYKTHMNELNKNE